MSPQICKVCTHKQKREIELALIRGESKTALSRTYSISRECLYNHQANHVGASVLAGTNLSARNHGVALLENLDEMIVAARRILNKAEADGHSKTALAAIKESRSSILAIAQITHSLWQQQQKESQLITVSPQSEYLNEQWGRNYKKLPLSEREAFEKVLLKCFHNTGGGYTETPEPIEPEKAPMSGSYEAPIVDIEDISDRPMKRSSLKKPK